MTNFFQERNGTRYVEDLALTDIAERFGTPCYVYSRAALTATADEFLAAMDGTVDLVCYAVKANGNLAILNLLARKGFGFDIVSGGELARVLAAGGDPAKIMFSGVGKTVAEMEAALQAGILCFNVESASELNVLAATATRLGKVAPVSIRVNPDVDAKTHPYISTGLKENKFGVSFDEAHALYRQAVALPSLRVTGIDMHIGSQITEIAPYREAAEKLLQLVRALEADGIALEHIDVGGGLGARYRDEQTISLAAFAQMLREVFAGRSERLMMEPGRRVVADAGVLLTRVLYLKPGETKNFAIVDAAMTDLMRPALYGAWHPVSAVTKRSATEKSSDSEKSWDIVGPVCESSDFLAQARPLVLREGDLLAVGVAGAYSMVMSSNYNARPRACEVMVDGKEVTVIRAREEIKKLWEMERILSK
ncbi:MAG: diaminopimelate decarboxylase [Proteobacteria bacterium]|nr:diaminopimelate decarboxylase [Pseudomonadota bacterium]MCL2308623.1 diaminopimelate decarboxylase [Pseudomonadota bacterium]